MTARQRLAKKKPPAATPIYDAVCKSLGVPGLGTYRPMAVVLADALLPSLHQTDGKSALEPLP